MERRFGGASEDASTRKGAYGVGCGVGQRGRGGGLAETVAPQRLRSVAEKVGGRADEIAWIDQQRRMSKDYERSCASGEALVYAAMIRLMTRRLASV